MSISRVDYAAEVRVLEITFVASAPRTANGNSPDLDLGDVDEIFVVLDVTAQSGTSPTLDVVIEGKDPVSGKYRTLYAFAQVGASTGTWDQSIGKGGQTNRVIPRTVRARWTLGGTSPSYTFSVGAVARSK